MNDLVTIADRAGAKDLPFLLSGGHAVIAHGFARSTFDLDLIVRRNDSAQWIELVSELAYTVHREGPTFLQFNAAKKDSFPLDLMLVNQETFSKLEAEAVPAPSIARGVKVVSLLHLVALKCHAIRYGHPGRIVKDVDDVIRLVQINRVDLDAPSIRELFLKHGTEELYQKVRRACRGE